MAHENQLRRPQGSAAKALEAADRLLRVMEEKRKSKLQACKIDFVYLNYKTDEKGKEFIESALSEIKKPTNVTHVDYADNSGEPVKIGEFVFNISIA